jgi:uncharacterized membrane protein
MNPPNRAAPNRTAGPKRPAAPNFSTSTTTGIEPNVAAALSYILGLITGIIFFALEKENKFVRFHAAQSMVVTAILIIVGTAISILGGVLAILPFLGTLMVFLLTAGLAIATFVLWLVLMWRAYSGDTWELPIAGDLARRLV